MFLLLVPTHSVGRAFRSKLRQARALNSPGHRAPRVNFWSPRVAWASAAHPRTCLGELRTSALPFLRTQLRRVERGIREARLDQLPDPPVARPLPVSRRQAPGPCGPLAAAFRYRRFASLFPRRPARRGCPCLPRISSRIGRWWRSPACTESKRPTMACLACEFCARRMCPVNMCVVYCCIPHAQPPRETVLHLVVCRAAA